MVSGAHEEKDTSRMRKLKLQKKVCEETNPNTGKPYVRSEFYEQLAMDEVLIPHEYNEVDPTDYTRPLWNKAMADLGFQPQAKFTLN